MPYESPCKLWDKALSPKGYGVCRHGNVMRLAHTVAYEIRFGAIPPGFDVHHQCNNRSCINTDHLIAIPHSDNVKYSKGWSLNPDNIWVCKRGHLITDFNIIQRKTSIKCRTCHNLRRRVNAT